MCFACTRIWCVRPVFSRHCIRDAVPPAKDSSTRHVLTACRPLQPSQHPCKRAEPTVYHDMLSTAVLMLYFMRDAAHPA